MILDRTVVVQQGNTERQQRVDSREHIDLNLVASRWCWGSGQAVLRYTGDNNSLSSPFNYTQLYVVPPVPIPPFLKTLQTMHCGCRLLLYLSTRSDTRTWGSGIYAQQQQQQARTAGLVSPQRAGCASPCMSLMLLADGDLPISTEQQETIISVFSVASSALLLLIIGGAGEIRDKDKDFLVCAQDSR